VGVIESTYQGRTEITAIDSWVGYPYRAVYILFLFVFCARALLALFALHGLMVYFFHFMLAHSFVFRLLWASIFYEGLPGLHPSGQLTAVQIRSVRICLWPKKRYQKKSHPTMLTCGVSVRFSLERALWNSLSLKQSSRDSALSLQCSTTQKGL